MILHPTPAATLTTWQTLAPQINWEQRQVLLAQAITRIQDLDLPLEVLRDRAQLEGYARDALLGEAARMGVAVSDAERQELLNQVIARAGGLGFINDLLPPARNDLTEIAMTPDGAVWVIRKGQSNFDPTDLRPTLEETWRAVEALLAPIGRSISEAQPAVDAKLPRIPDKAGDVAPQKAGDSMGGARVHILHPTLVPGKGYPAITIRLFEPRPVNPAQIIAWQMAPPALLKNLIQAVQDEYRILIIGGTATGKTTLLSALCSGIPKQARVVKVEDPEEIWLDHPHVVTLEARPVTVGSSAAPFRIKDGVDHALRMAPRWLIVGEVRSGDAALALFRAQMSDHPGLSTFHAESPAAAATRMSLIMQADSGVDLQAATLIFGQAIDLVVQVGWQAGLRRVLGVYEVGRARGLQMDFRSLYQYGDPVMAAPQPRDRSRI